MPTTDGRGGTVVIGLGSPLMGDDGFGLEVLERLRSRWEFAPDIELIDGGTWGMNLLPTIEDAARVLILDAIDRESEAGTVAELCGMAVPRYLSLRLSPHQIDLADVLALAQLRGTLPGELVAIGAQPARVRLGLGLSPALEAAVDPAVARVIACLLAWGIHAREVETARA